MSWKNAFILGLISSVLSSLACIIYANIYKEAFYIDFSKVIGIANIISACTIGCFLMATVYALIYKWQKQAFLGWVNVSFSIISFASIAGVLGFQLPLDIESPEMFPGMVIPMHFFPLLSLLSIFPFFKLSNLLLK